MGVAVIERGQTGCVRTGAASGGVNWIGYERFAVPLVHKPRLLRYTFDVVDADPAVAYTSTEQDSAVSGILRKANRRLNFFCAAMLLGGCRRPELLRIL